jgi:hypothetical protein
MISFASSWYNLGTYVGRVIVCRYVASETFSHGNGFTYGVLVTDRKWTSRGLIGRSYQAQVRSHSEMGRTYHAFPTSLSEILSHGSLVDDQDNILSGQGIIIRESGRNRAKVPIYRTVRIVSSDIDWTIKIMNY